MAFSFSSDGPHKKAIDNRVDIYAYSEYDPRYDESAFELFDKFGIDLLEAVQIARDFGLLLPRSLSYSTDLRVKDSLSPCVRARGLSDLRACAFYSIDDYPTLF